jgi:ribosomal protein L29
MSGSVALYEALKSVKVSDDLARAAAADVPAFDLSQLATKADLAELRLATKADFAELRTELRTDIAALRLELRTEIAALRTDMAHQTYRIVGILGALMAIAAAAAKFL